MTIWELMRLMRSHPVLVAVMLLLSAVALALASRPVEVWNGEVRVIFLKPTSSPGNALAATSVALVSMAGIVARDVEGFSSTPQTVNSFVTLASQGVVTGVEVRQRNSGGQWDHNYEDPVLNIQSTGPTREVAQAQLQAGVNSVMRTLDDLQNRESVPTDSRIRARLSAGNPEYTTQKGSRVRAVCATALVCGLITVGALALVERRSQGLGAVRLRRLWGRRDSVLRRRPVRRPSVTFALAHAPRSAGPLTPIPPRPRPRRALLRILPDHTRASP